MKRPRLLPAAAILASSAAVLAMTAAPAGAITRPPVQHEGLPAGAHYGTAAADWSGFAYITDESGGNAYGHLNDQGHNNAVDTGNTNATKWEEVGPVVVSGGHDYWMLESTLGNCIEPPYDSNDLPLVAEGCNVALSGERWWHQSNDVWTCLDGTSDDMTATSLSNGAGVDDEGGTLDAEKQWVQ